MSLAERLTTTGKIITVVDRHIPIIGEDMVEQNDGNDRFHGIEDGHHRTIEVATAIPHHDTNTTTAITGLEAGREARLEVNGDDRQGEEEVVAAVAQQALFLVPAMATNHIAEAAVAQTQGLNNDLTVDHIDTRAREEEVEAGTKGVEEVEVGVYLPIPCRLPRRHQTRNKKKWCHKRRKTSRPLRKISAPCLFPSWSCEPLKKIFVDISGEK